MTTIWNTLSTINQRMEEDIQQLLKLISQLSISTELRAYQSSIASLCTQLIELVKTCQIYISQSDPDTLDDIIALTQTVNYYITLANRYLATPIVRALGSDRLCLYFIKWLHKQHNLTEQYPAAFTDGAPAIRPFTERPPTPIYYFPFSKQTGLLYQPLLFHEFGHLLYAVYEPEMKDLIEELQRKISSRLTPLSQRNDGFSRQQANYRQAIVDTWYSWIQEFFCDAVGFTIGGPCYIHAFSAYLVSVNEMSFYRTPEYLENSEHPVTWLRVQILSDRIKSNGYPELAKQVRDEWFYVAKLLGIQEDYHGYYHQSLRDDIKSTIDDMLLVADPRNIGKGEASPNPSVSDTDSPIQLLNWAWEIFLKDRQKYAEWEQDQIERLLNTTTFEV